MKKIIIPTKEQKRIAALESENSSLWYENITLQSDVEKTKQEISDLWYATIIGGGN